MKMTHHLHLNIPKLLVSPDAVYAGENVRNQLENLKNYKPLLLYTVYKNDVQAEL